jgi:hypothetical protein
MLFGCFSVLEEPRVTLSASPEAPATVRPGPIAPANPAPEVVFEGLSGAEAARARAAFAPARERLGECRPGTNGVLRLRLVKRGPHAEYVLEATTALDPRQRTCVLETLSTVDLDGAALSGVTFDGAARPPGVTTHLRIEW